MFSTRILVLLRRLLMSILYPPLRISLVVYGSALRSMDSPSSTLAFLIWPILSCCDRLHSNIFLILKRLLSLRQLNLKIVTVSFTDIMGRWHAVEENEQRSPLSKVNAVFTLTVKLEGCLKYIL